MAKYNTCLHAGTISVSFLKLANPMQLAVGIVTYHHNHSEGMSILDTTDAGCCYQHPLPLHSLCIPGDSSNGLSLPLPVDYCSCEPNTDITCGHAVDNIVLNPHSDSEKG